MSKVTVLKLMLLVEAVESKVMQALLACGSASKCLTYALGELWVEVYVGNRVSCLTGYRTLHQRCC